MEESKGWEKLEESEESKGVQERSWKSHKSERSSRSRSTRGKQELEGMVKLKKLEVPTFLENSAKLKDLKESGVGGAAGKLVKSQVFGVPQELNEWTGVGESAEGKDLEKAGGVRGDGSVG